MFAKIITMDLQQLDGSQALIFDVDGTLADSMPVHLKAWQKVGTENGFYYSREDFYHNAGMSGQAVVRVINEQQGLNLNPEEVAQAKEAAFLEKLEEVRPIEPVVAIVENYHGKIPIAAGTGSFRHVAVKTLKYLGLYNKIDVLVSADDVENHKPAPDTFLQCAQYLNVKPEACMVFEDAELGFQAAANAGMHYIDVRPFYENKM